MASTLPDLAAGHTHAPVVYYIGRGSRLKIGVTKRLSRRLIELEADVLLAIEPGGHEQEARRHRQFQQWRIRGEWYEAADPLLELIDHLTAANPLPDLTVAPTGRPRLNPGWEVVGVERSRVTGETHALITTGRTMIESSSGLPRPELQTLPLSALDDESYDTAIAIMRRTHMIH